MLVVAVLLACACAHGRDVLIASYGTEGPVRNGGIATFTASLAQLLQVQFAYYRCCSCLRRLPHERDVM